MKNKVLYVGFEVGVKKNAVEILGEPKCPANYKPETYQAKLPELREKMLATAHNDMRAGAILDIAVYDPEDGSVSSVKLKELFDMAKSNTFIVGFSPQFRLQQAAWEARKVPTWIWCEGYNNVEFVDLYKLSGAKADGMRLSEMISYWLPSGVDAKTAAGSEALAAKLIADEMGLTDPNTYIHFS